MTARGGAYTFEVHPKANKAQIRQAIEKIYNVKVSVGSDGEPARQAPAVSDDDGHDAPAGRRRSWCCTRTTTLTCSKVDAGSRAMQSLTRAK